MNEAEAVLKAADKDKVNSELYSKLSIKKLREAGLDFKQNIKENTQLNSWSLIISQLKTELEYV